MVRAAKFNTLEICLAPKVFARDFKITENLITAPRIQRIIATVVSNVRNDFANQRTLRAVRDKTPADLRRLQNTEVVAHARVGRDVAKKSANTRAAAVLHACEGNFLAAQAGRGAKNIHVFTQ